MIKVICFDMDDTLCDETKSDTFARSQVFHYVQTNHQDIDFSNFKKNYRKIWEDIDQQYEVLITQPGIGEKELRLDHAKRVLHSCDVLNPPLAYKLMRLYWEERRKALHLYPDSLQTLLSLQQSYKLSLLTNGPSDMQRQKITDLQIAPYFEHIIIAGEVGYSKPDPAIFQILIKNYALPPSEILYVGNSQKRDVIGAHRAGLQIAWINRKKETRNLNTPNPHFEITNLSELLHLHF
jgi:HAD superfamily hydrolase (TIGR02253 family)